MKALTTAFLMWQDEQEHRHEAAEQTSWNMYRRKLKAFNRDKLIVSVDTSFGIFFSHEVFMLTGVPVRNAEKEISINPRSDLYPSAPASPPSTLPDAHLSFHFAGLSLAQFLTSEFEGLVNVLDSIHDRCYPKISKSEFLWLVGLESR